ncbi:hypothetical protein V2J09_018337 [Rumex salicifolius]
MSAGNCAVQAISLIINKGVLECNIIFLSLISVTFLSFNHLNSNFKLTGIFHAPQGVHAVCKAFPRVKIVTFEIDIGLNKEFRVVPGMGEFDDRYFGTDD